MGLFDGVETFFDVIFNSEEYEDTGKAGERYTYRKIKDNFPDGRVFRNVYLKKSDGTYTEIDLLAVGHKGIYVFESKNYSGWIFGSEKQSQWTQSLPTGFKNKFFSPILQNNAHIKALQHTFQQYPNIRYFSFVVFSERCELKKVECDLPNTFVLKRDDLERKLRKVFKSDLSETISKSDMVSILNVLSNSQRPDQEVREQHLKDLQENLAKCPKCKSDLVERKNKETGEAFYSCSAFPRCKYIAKDPQRIEAIKEKPEPPKVETPPPIAEEPPIEEPKQEANAKCPKCGNDLVERKNKAKGNVFLGCKAFPKCRYTSEVSI